MKERESDRTTRNRCNLIKYNFLRNFNQSKKIWKEYRKQNNKRCYKNIMKRFSKELIRKIMSKE